MDFDGVHAIVTGGSAGIGLATVGKLIRLGSKVTVIALGDDDLERLAASPPRGRHPVHLEAADVGDRSQVDGAIASAAAQYGPCSILVASAGVARPGYFTELPDEEFERHMRVNYFGTLHAIRAVVPAMIEQQRGSIVAISSAAGLLGVFGYAAYGPTKYAVRGLCDVLRTELRPHGIHVSCVYPADVDTAQLAGEAPFKPAETQAIAGTIRPIPPAQVADAIIEGISERRPAIFSDRSTALLSRATRFAPGLIYRWMDRKAARAARHGQTITRLP